MYPLREKLRHYFETTRPPGVVSAYLFGSQARGMAHRESDIDVALLLDYVTQPTRTTRSRFAMYLAEELIAATHHNDMDLVVLNDAPPELGAAVVTTDVRLYCADEATDHAFVRTVLLRHADLRPFLARTRRLKLQALTS